jgi:hypothetical protein
MSTLATVYSRNSRYPNLLTTIFANIAIRSARSPIIFSAWDQALELQPGIKLRSDTPPDTRYRNGISGVIRSMDH